MNTIKIINLKRISSMPGIRKHIIKYNGCNAKNLFTYNHHLLKASRKLTTAKLTLKEIFVILIFNVVSKPSLNIYFEELFKINNLNWKNIYRLPSITTYIRAFISVNNIKHCIVLNKNTVTLWN